MCVTTTQCRVSYDVTASGNLEKTFLLLACLCSGQLYAGSVVLHPAQAPRPNTTGCHQSRRLHEPFIQLSRLPIECGRCQFATVPGPSPASPQPSASPRRRTSSSLARGPGAPASTSWSPTALCCTTCRGTRPGGHSYVNGHPPPRPRGRAQPGHKCKQLGSAQPPSHDTQAIARTWRYGQTRPVFVYRCVACHRLAGHRIGCLHFARG